MKRITRIADVTLDLRPQLRETSGELRHWNANARARYAVDGMPWHVYDRTLGEESGPIAGTYRFKWLATVAAWRANA